MIKEIKIKREITAFIKGLDKDAGVVRKDRIHMDYYSSNNTKIQVNNYFLGKTIFIHVERFPYYNKMVHSMVMDYLNEYKNYKVKLWKESTNTYINVDEL